LYQKTRDPLFLVVPRELMVEGYGENAKFGTRSTGLVFNNLPAFIGLVDAVSGPRPDVAWSVKARTAEISLRRGETVQACFEVTNSGQFEIADVRSSFQARLDFRNAAPREAVNSLRPSQTVELCYPLTAPEEINLTSQYNRIACAHWSAIGRRKDTPVLAHACILLQLRP